MVTEDDNQKESRPPTLEDLVSLCRELNNKKAKYIVIGGMAIAHHGLVRGTEDIDLLIETTNENEKAIIAAVSTLPDQAAKELQPGDINEYEVIRVADEIVVDLMKSACGVSYSDAAKGIVYATKEGVKIPFAGIDLLMRLKQSIRPKDKMDLEFLKALKANQSKS